MRTRGFLFGGTAGRTTLNGEGLQHQDGHSHLLAYPVPNLVAYDPAYAYELSAIVKDGIRRMYEKGEDVFYYVTIHNENYVQPPMPKGVEEGILKGLYLLKPGPKKGKLKAQLLGSGAILNEALKAQELLAGLGVSADVWSVTSYKELRRDALDAERWSLLHPGEKPRIPYLRAALAKAEGPFVAASDNLKALPDSVAKWIPGELLSLGTDGFGRSDTREGLRDFFEVDARHIALAALTGLLRAGKLKADAVKKAMKALKLDPDKPDPMTS
jgi:pyruvate dehydrogenase E1 component